MERAYQRRYPRPADRGRYNRTGARGGRQKAETYSKMSYKTKLCIQTAACIIIFAVLWGINATDTDIAAAVRGTVTTAFTAETDFEHIYKSAVQMSQGLVAMMVREAPQEGAEQGEAAEPEESAGSVEAAGPIAPQEDASDLTQDNIGDTEPEII